MRTRTTHLCDATIFAADDPRERVRKSGRVGADERARLVHVGAQLEELKMSTICIVGPQIQMVMYWNFLALDQHQSTTLHWLKRLRLGWVTSPPRPEGARMRDHATYSSRLRVTHVFFCVMNGSGRGQAGALGVHELVGDLEAGREAARVALLVLRRAQPEVDLRSRGGEKRGEGG